jgi:hypothetical protein
MGMRLRGFTQGFFGWLRKAPWGDPGFSSLVLSVTVFGFVGGITGVTFGTEQINIIAHNTLRIPGHFHATVVSGTAMAFMGVTWYVIPLIFRKQIAFYPLVKIQPYLFAFGMLIFSLAMTFAGTFGAPRRLWDMTYSGAPFDVQYSPAMDIIIAVMAIGGLLGITGGAIYISRPSGRCSSGSRFRPGRRRTTPGASRRGSSTGPGPGFPPPTATRRRRVAGGRAGHRGPRGHLLRGLRGLLLRQLGPPLVHLAVG